MTDPNMSFAYFLRLVLDAIEATGYRIVDWRFRSSVGLG